MLLKEIIFGSKDNKKIVNNFILVPLAIVFVLFVGVLLVPVRQAEISSYPNPDTLEKGAVKHTFAISVIWAPMIEEALFRGPILFSFLTFFKKRPVKGIYKRIQLIGKILTIAIALSLTFGFAVIHIYNGGFYLLRTTLFHTGIFSVVMVLLTIKSKSLMYPTLAHSLNNLLYWMFG